MITIKIPKGKWYDSKKNLFYTNEKDTYLQLEHSLISLQKWEAKWHKPFLDSKDKTYEETLDYVRCMCLTQNVNPDLFYLIPKKEMDKISDYINDPMTATWFNENTTKTRGKPVKKQIVTAEIIYYWMITGNIPTEYRKWHLNQLLTLIRVIEIKNDEKNVNNKKRRSRNAILQDYKAINEANKQRFNTTG